MTEPITEFRGKYAFLSNFYPVRIVYEGLTYPTVEHAFQASKSIHPEAREIFTQLATAKEAKSFGRCLRIRDDWESVKLQIMLDLLRLKFEYMSFRQQLLSTGDADLVEGNTWNDTFWGQCPLGNGQNRLGSLLMQVRRELAGD